MATQCKGKSSWPEVVGKRWEEAVATIERENPRVDARVVSVGEGVTLDFRCDRVWVWINSDGAVTKVPKIG